MRKTKAIQATPENFKRFGKVENLYDYKCFSGEGWKCWMTEDDCMESGAHFGMTYVKTDLPYEVHEMERHTKTQELMVCGSHAIVVALADSDPMGCAKAEDIQAFIIKPGQLLIINKGIWHDACHAFWGPTFYYFLGLETDEPAVFKPVDRGPVKIMK